MRVLRWWDAAGKLEWDPSSDSKAERQRD
jgi:hypothetical protein